MKKLYICRHGETDFNKDKLNQGSAYDISLNDNGKEEAKKTADLIKNFGIQYIYTSYLKRAKETAEIIAKILNTKFEVFKGLEEIDMGICSGQPRVCINKYIKDYSIIKNDRNIDLRFPNGESKFESRERISNTILEICHIDKGHDIIGILSHGFVIKELLRKCDFPDDSGIKNCEIVEAEFDSKSDSIKILRRIISGSNSIDSECKLIG